MKKCNKCQIEKSINDFHKDKYSKDGIDNRCKQCRSDYFQANKEIYRKRTAEWKENNIDKWREQDSLRQKKRRKEKPHLRRWAVLLERALKRTSQSKTTTTYNLLKYTPQELKEHLENQGMDWDKHDIDHKVPLTWFISETPPHIVNDLRNLQPLDRNLNKTKSNSYSSKIDPDYYSIIIKWVKEEYKKDLAF
jgi:hypothetical protein